MQMTQNFIMKHNVGIDWIKAADYYCMNEKDSHSPVCPKDNGPKG